MLGGNNMQAKLMDYLGNRYKMYVMSIIRRHNKYSKDVDAIFVFRNPIEAHLWIEEFTGQISDGKYENHPKNYSRYGGGAYRFWCGMPVRLGNATKIIGRIPYDADMALRFTDLMWLFSEENASEGEYAIRRVGSKLPRNVLKRHIMNIEKAIRIARKGSRPS